MLKRIPALLLFSIILSNGYFSTFAWDDTGHKISAYIAWQNMTPAARDKAISLLEKAPEESQIAAFYMTYGSQSQDVRKLEYFMLLASWADIIRDRDFKARYKFHKGNWHYSDTFWTVRNGAIETLPDPEDGGQAILRIKEFMRTIEGNGSAADKAVAIAWLEHLIGDVHQPLHTSARVTERELKGDQGGNLFLLTPDGTPRESQQNLHSFWDGIVVRTEPNADSECDRGYLEPIARKFMKDHPVDKLRSRLAAADPDKWARESLALAQTEVFSRDLIRFQAPSNNYKKRAYKISGERLALAGYRMAEVFNKAFGSSQPVSPK
jgi:hypothetical protein